jgi:hypothetical protein
MPRPKNDAPGFRNPHNLPTKVCPACRRPFTWRKKWERDWESVIYCSDACRKKGRGATPPPARPGPA